MAVFSKQSYRWIIVLTFLAIIIVPGMMPSPTLRNSTLGVIGALCLLFQFLNLSVVDPNRNRKTDIIQSWVLIFFTIILLIANFMV
ncbi:hypothetical protein [Emticicia sp. C21]|uniref:hypothetical protein n=1 Tax=Emticicia sp. C21 TaxID=2302915 RepID=UPI000E35558A|nr:hypothetical protein [Emticicia sp. C21]RFS14628.1 hypothetical protein D0T08_20565 [Emticicia sp. C21]